MLEKQFFDGTTKIKDAQRVIDPLIIQNSLVDEFGPSINEFELTVPEDYCHKTQLNSFCLKTKDLETTESYDENLTDVNFSRVSHELIPGKTYTVRLIPIKSSATSEECLDMYARHNAVLVGAQGLTLLQEKHPDKFPVDKFLISFGLKESLWKDPDGSYRILRISKGYLRKWNFYLSIFYNSLIEESDSPDDVSWNSTNVIVVFSEGGFFRCRQ